MTTDGSNGADDGEYEANFRDNVFGHSAEMPEGTPRVSGIEFNDYKDRDMTVAEMVNHMTNVGYQATAVAEAARIMDIMVLPLPSLFRKPHRISYSAEIMETI